MDAQTKSRSKPTHISFQNYRTGGQPAGSADPVAVVVEALTTTIRTSTSCAPAAMLEALLFPREDLPVHGVWHHVLTGEVLLVALKNAGYPISEELLDESWTAASRFPAAHAASWERVGPSRASSLHAPCSPAPRLWRLRRVARTLAFAAKLAARLAELSGNRCCKKSSYLALQLAHAESAELGFELPVERFEGCCSFAARNDTCDGVDCPFHPGNAQ